MEQECTELFLHYREIARLNWNLGFMPFIDLRSLDIFTVGEYIAAFDEAMARLYEGLVLLRLGHDVRVREPHAPGKAVPFKVDVQNPKVEYLVDQNLPTDSSHIWRPIDVPLHPGSYEFEFVAFFDWDQLVHRELQFFEVLIRRMDARPETVGRHALIEVSKCSVWPTLLRNPD